MTNEELRELCEKRGRNIYLLPDPGGAVARDCTEEITALLDENELQAAVIEKIGKIVADLRSYKNIECGRLIDGVTRINDEILKGHKE